MQGDSLRPRVPWARLLGPVVVMAMLAAGFFVARAQETGTGTPGRPAAIHAGTCDNFEPAALFSLDDVVLRTDFDDDDDDDDGRAGQGGLIGSANAVPVAHSDTEINANFGALIGQPHVVVVFDSAANADSVIACGEIGGFSADDEDLAFGLTERNGSGHYGIAVLDDDDDDNEVEVDIYLASPGAVPGAAATGQQSSAPSDDDDDFDDDFDDDGFDDDGIDDDNP